MTIKEIEALCEMTRANIRFYESEGLLTPARNQNGYRDYSEEDAEVLKRIKLLRTLHISLEEIKALHAGEQELTEVLARHVISLEQQKTDLTQSQEICQVMRRDGVHYESLNAQRYLDVMKQKPEAAATIPELVADTMPRERIPWRRFWARNLDLMLYSTIWSLFLVGICNVNLNDRSLFGNLFDEIMGMALLFLAEPALLACWGTTPGKWILGLYVTDTEERKLSYGQACSRTWLVLWEGMGLQLPIYSLYRRWKSYIGCSDGETLSWEVDTCITLRDRRRWRVVAMVVAYAAVFAGLFLGIARAQLPKHRGEITVMQFCENYNRLADYYGMDANYDLSSSGEWLKQWGASDNVIVVGGFVERPKLTFAEENGVMTGVQFSLSLQDYEGWLPSYQEEMMLMVLSFVSAQEECGIFSEEREEMLRLIEDSAFESYSFHHFGVEVDCAVAYTGYEKGFASVEILWPEEGKQKSYEIRFEMRK